MIIVDDASQDGSSRIIAEFKEAMKRENVEVVIFTHASNRGKGAALRTALRAAKGEFSVVQDADLEYDPRDIPRLLQEAVEGGHQVVYGSRFLGKISGMSLPNYVANKSYNALLRHLYDTEITDMHTCYKMVRTDLLKRLKLTASGFDYATELVSKLLKRGVRIHEVPIDFQGRTKREGKKIDMLDGVECAYKLVRYRFGGKDSIFSEKSTTFWRFLIVGSVGFATNYALLVLLGLAFDLHHAVAEAFAALLALQVTFLLHDHWTYLLHVPPGTERLKKPTRYMAYLLSNSFGVFITVAAFSLLYPTLPRFPSLLIAALFALVWNYSVNTYVIWRRRKRSAGR